MKPKGINQTEFLALLQKVLPKATQDPHLASSIYEQIAKEVRLINSLESFEKFCEEGSLPNLEPDTVAELQSELAEKFGEANIAITAEEDGGGVAVEITLPDRTLNSTLKVKAVDEEEEVIAPFVPFPVCLPDDPELVWVLARRENLGPDEAVRALVLIEEEFWATKGGQKLQKEQVDKTFAEFIAHVPAAALKESGLKRHYKEPETLKALQLLTRTAPAELSEALA